VDDHGVVGVDAKDAEPAEAAGISWEEDALA
jgi:hypothetical protein